MPFPVYPKSPALQGHVGAVHVVKYNTTGQYVLSGGHDKKIILWNPNTSKLVKDYVGHGYEVLDISVSFDNSRFVSCGGDRSIYLWDVTTGSTTRRFSGHMSRVNAVDFNFDASLIASGSYDAKVRLWDTKSSSYKPIQVLEESKDSVTSLQIVDYEIITGSVDGYLRVYDIRMGQLTSDYIGHPITSVTQSSDAASILVSTLDSTLRLMDKSNGSLLQSYVGHKNSDFRVRSTFGDNDVYVVSGSENGKLLAWDLLSGRIVHELRTHKDKLVSAVAYHPKNSQMVSCGADGTVQVWNAI
ncbi:WD40-repeat-containing domain protein [Lipomyces japonicus]|uniref:WD40-repeat-containing domain protein n=1 Tax=Lipomyces japonicus TaxID=56871 RepID=UPI0034CFB56F